MPATYEKIATTTLGSAQSNITFSSIPATYTDLRLVVVCTTSAAGNLQMRFNSDSATNYSQTALAGNGATAASGRATGMDFIWWNQYGGTSTTVPKLFTVDIFSYAGSTYKTGLLVSSEDANGSGNIENIVSLWRSTSVINSIFLFCNGTNTLSTGTTATLYGILRA